MRPLKVLFGEQRIKMGWRTSLLRKMHPVILMYHNVLPTKSLPFNLRSHLAEDFEQQISYLSSHFDIVSCQDIAKEPRIGKLAISFDDGLANNFSVAAPILQKYKVPATFFVSTAHIGTAKLLWPDELEWVCSYSKGPVSFLKEKYHQDPTLHLFLSRERKRLTHEVKMLPHLQRLKFIEELRQKLQPNTKDPDLGHYRTMDEKELKELSSNPLFTIGSHAVNHIPLANLSTEEQNIELRESKIRLESIINQPVDLIAFPDGSFGEETLRIAAELGYLRGFGVNSSHSAEDPGLPVYPRRGLYTDSRWNTQLHDLFLEFNY